MRSRVLDLVRLASLLPFAAAAACDGRIDAGEAPAEGAAPTFAPAAVRPEVVMTGVGEPSAVAVAGDRIVVATRTTRVGGEDVAAGALFVRTAHAPKPLMILLDARGASFDALAVEDGTAFVAASDGRVVAQPVTGGPLRTLATLAEPATALVAIAPYVLAAQASGDVVRIDTRTGQAAPIARFDGAIGALTRRGNAVVVAAPTASGGTVAEVAVDGTVTTLATLDETPCALSADRDAVAWTTTSLSAATPRGHLGIVEAGAEPRVLTEIDAFACAVTASGDDLFFATSRDVPSRTGLIRSASAALMRASARAPGAAPSPVVSESAPRVHPGALLATEGFVYWLTADAVVRLAK